MLLLVPFLLRMQFGQRMRKVEFNVQPAARHRNIVKHLDAGNHAGRGVDLAQQRLEFVELAALISVAMVARFKFYDFLSARSIPA
ncbi:MAG: hypothetical protein IPM06_17905 [Rhizobiales bacterium]|nr:hypothetical protein [Hyphomicrobiales bacterium]